MEAIMNPKTSNSSKSEAKLVELRLNFQVLPWKWADELTNRSRYLVGSALFCYLTLAYLTLFPSRNWIIPLKHYPSLHLILIGWIVVIILAIHWRHKIPLLLQWLSEGDRLRPQTGNSGVKFEQHIHNYQKALHSKGKSLALGITLPVLFFAFMLAVNWFEAIIADFSPVAAFLCFLVSFIGLFWFFIIGQYGWVMYVTGKFIKEVTLQYEIEVKPSHPDKCGGLKPLGDFCFNAALPLVAGSIVLALIPILNMDIEKTLSIFAVNVLFIVAGPMAAGIVFLPLWDIHTEMVKQKNAYQDVYTTQVSELEQAIHTNTSLTGNLQDAKTAKEKLEILQMLHPDKLSYPLWPFNLPQTVVTIFAPQIVAVLQGIFAKILALLHFPTTAS